MRDTEIISKALLDATAELRAIATGRQSTLMPP
jgi:hypothetical protein